MDIMDQGTMVLWQMTSFIWALFVLCASILIVSTIVDAEVKKMKKDANGRRIRISEYTVSILRGIEEGRPASRWSEPGRIPSTFLDMRSMKGLLNHGFIRIDGDMACITNDGKGFLRANEQNGRR